MTTSSTSKRKRTTRAKRPAAKADGQPKRSRTSTSGAKQAPVKSAEAMAPVQIMPTEMAESAVAKPKVESTDAQAPVMSDAAQAGAAIEEPQPAIGSDGGDEANEVKPVGLVVEDETPAESEISEVTTGNRTLVDFAMSIPAFRARVVSLLVKKSSRR